MGARQGRDGFIHHIHKRDPILVPFWESNYYGWLKANDFNLLMLVP